MTGHTALLASIVESPHDDTPRLVYADYLEGIGEQDRAEFIRVQVELARDPDSGGICECGSGIVMVQKSSYPAPLARCVQCLKDHGHWRPFMLLHRQKELWKPPLNREWLKQLDVGMLVLREADVSLWCNSTVVISRGFGGKFIGTWSEYLRVEASLIQGSVPCPDYGEVLLRHPQDCRCSGTGLVKRPFVETMQPISRVVLSAVPGGMQDVSREDLALLPPAGGAGSLSEMYRFDRVKCSTCDGTGVYRVGGADDYPSLTNCGCGRRPLNEWTCPRWPSVFEMPEQHGTDYDIVDGRIIYAQRGTGAYRYYGEAVAALRGNL